MTGSPDPNVSRLNDFLTAAKGESAPLAGQKGKPLHPFSIRLTQEERERLEGEAKGKPLGVYIRERLLGDGTAPRKLRRKPAADQAGLAKVLGMLGQSRLANNLNQIAKAAISGCWSSPRRSSRKSRKPAGICALRCQPAHGPLKRLRCPKRTVPNQN